MKLQKQTSFGGPNDPDPGNCWSTCIAMLLGMDTKLVPNFCGQFRDDDGLWYRKANEWLADRGVALMTFNTDPVKWGPAYADAVCIASGPAARGHNHSVLWQSGKLLHDPHPSDAGLIEAVDFDIVVVKNPELFRDHLLSLMVPTGEGMLRVTAL